MIFSVYFLLNFALLYLPVVHLSKLIPQSCCHTPVNTCIAPAFAILLKILDTSVKVQTPIVVNSPVFCIRTKGTSGDIAHCTIKIGLL